MSETNKIPPPPAAKKIALEIVTHFALSKNDKGRYLTLSGDEIKSLAILFMKLFVKYKDAFKFIDNPSVYDEELINHVTQAISDYVLPEESYNTKT